MITSNKIEVSEALKNKDFESAFKFLLEYGGNDFISYFQKKELLYNKAALDFFFQKLHHWDRYFEAFESCGRVHEILEIYLLKYHKVCPDFEAFLALNHSNSFISAIRTNEVYLQPERQKHLLTLDYGSVNNLHKDVWAGLSKMNDELLRQITELREKCINFSKEEILFFIVIWIEKVRAEDYGNALLVNKLADTYSFVIENIIGNTSNSNDLPEHDFNFQFFFFTSQENNQKYNAYEELFNAIYYWKKVKNDMIDIYSFQLATQPYIEDGSLFLLDKPLDYYKWKETDVRLNYNRLRYIRKGAFIYEEMEESGNVKIGGKTESDKLINKNALIQGFGVCAQLEDLCITELQYNSTKIDILPIINSLIGHSTNCQARYEETLMNVKTNTNSINEAINMVFKEHLKHKRLVLPFVRISNEDFVKRHLSANKLIDRNSVEAIMNIFRWTISSKSKTNKLSSRFDVKVRPFVQIGNYMFISTTFFANTDWTYTLSESSFKSEDKLHNSKCFEDKLKDAFKEIDLKIEDYDFKDKKRGDVDVLVSSEAEILLIQVKRTKFRANLKDQFLEYINVDFKAARQLNEAELFLNNNGYINGRKVTKWIVSNSFERIGDSFSDCTKINYFDLLDSLNKMKGANLNEIINKMEDPRLLHELCTSLRREQIPFSNEFEIDALNKSLFIENFESKAYKLMISSSNPLCVAENLFNEANLQYNNGNLPQALDLYLRCLNLKPNDGDIYGAIANVFADIRDYTQANNFFIRALQLLPSDPHILRNISGFLWDARNFGESIKAYIKLFTLYPLIDLYPIEIPIMFQQAIELNFLTEKEIIEIEDLIQKMNGV